MAVVPINGRNINLFVAEAGDDPILIGCAQSISFSGETEMEEASCRASGGHKEVTPGEHSASISISAGFREFTSGDVATNVGQKSLDELRLARTLLDWEFTDAVTGHTKRAGQAYISKVSEEAPLKGIATFSAELVVTGAYTITTVS